MSGGEPARACQIAGGAPGRIQRHTTDDNAPAASAPASCPVARRGAAPPRARSQHSWAGSGRSRRSTGRSRACTHVTPPAEIWRLVLERGLPTPRQRRGRRSSSRRYSASKALWLTSSNTRFGITTTSNPGAILLRRNTSRISRLALFLATAPPNFRVAAIPRRADSRPLDRRNSVQKRL